jgi:hypothetical protein
MSKLTNQNFRKLSQKDKTRIRITLLTALPRKPHFRNLPLLELLFGKLHFLLCDNKTLRNILQLPGNVAHKFSLPKSQTCTRRKHQCNYFGYFGASRMNLFIFGIALFM